MRLNRPLTGLLVAVVLALGVRELVRHYAPAVPPDPVPASADTAVQTLLAMHLTDVQGTPQPLARWRGHPLLINFWASWCPPCVNEMPMLDIAARENKTTGVQVLGIAWDKRENVAIFLREAKLSYPVLIADDATTALLPSLGNTSRGIPFSLLTDADGRVRHVRLGPLGPAELRDWLAEAQNHSVPNGSEKK